VEENIPEGSGVTWEELLPYSRISVSHSELHFCSPPRNVRVSGKYCQISVGLNQGASDREGAFDMGGR